jgi:(4S)-4-hydroxy-5-phosphonooxypentane-2,3-dione isomerase
MWVCSVRRGCLSFLLVVVVFWPSLVLAEEKENPILTLAKASVKNPEKPFTLIVALKVKEGAREKFEAAFARASRATHKEKGNLRYDLNRDTKEPSGYLVYERWKSVAALEQHLKTDHIKELLAALPDLLAGSPEPHILLPVGP